MNSRHGRKRNISTENLPSEKVVEIDSLRQPLLMMKDGSETTWTTADSDESGESEQLTVTKARPTAGDGADGHCYPKGGQTSQNANSAVPLYPTSTHGGKLSLWDCHKLSLSRAPSTNGCFTWLIPLVSLVTHGVFYYGQTRPMWQLHLSQQVEVWANATSFESRTALHTLGLPHDNYMGAHHETQISTFTYWYAIQELWEMRELPNPLLSQFAAVMLVLFSGIWPHLKLLLLNITWLFSVNSKRRSRILCWLSILGKWSVVDVFVVCVMVGVLHLDWVVDPHAIMDGLMINLPFVLQVVKSLYSSSDICTMLLKNVDCHEKHESWKSWGECKACVGLVKSTLEHPETALDSFLPIVDGMELSGGGLVTLRVLGMNGIYAFCTAVVCSILISVLVDILDGRAHRAGCVDRRPVSALQQPQRRPFMLLPNGSNEPTTETEDVDYDDSEEEEGYFCGVDSSHLSVDEDDSTRGIEEENHHSQTSDEAFHELVQSASPTFEPMTVLRHVISLLLCITTTYAVFSGIVVESIERRVHGAIPEFLNQVVGIVWDSPYSFLGLVQTTGEAGGMDLLLMATFGLFLVMGPAIRSTLCLLAWCLAEGKPRQTLLTTIELVGAFCAWEVFVFAVGMVHLLMPSVTNTILEKRECAVVSEDGTCLKVNFEIHKSFLWVVFGGTLLIGVSNLLFGNRQVKPTFQHASSSP